MLSHAETVMTLLLSFVLLLKLFSVVVEKKEVSSSRAVSSRTSVSIALKSGLILYT